MAQQHDALLYRCGWKLSFGTMVTVIRKNTPKKRLKALLKKAKPAKRKGLDAKKFSGKLKLDEDPLLMQKRMRAEWDERSA